MKPTIDEIFATPDHYLFGFEGDQAIFRRMDRAAYGRSIFLDRRIEAAGDEVFTMPVERLQARHAEQPILARRTGWIFHIAHCGSTLLARALDLPERGLVLREPLALRQLAVARAGMKEAAQGWRQQLALTAAMLGRRYDPDAPVVVKANVPVNFILPELMALDGEAPAILLYFPLRAHLAAILGSPHHRNWVVNVTGQLQGPLTALFGPIDRLDVPERLAALWLAEMSLFTDAAHGPAVRSLDAEMLFARPRATLAAALAHFGLRAGEDEIEAQAAGPLFATYSKQPGIPFDNEARLERRAQAERLFAAEIPRAMAWARAKSATLRLPDRLGQPLTGEAPLLLD